MLIYLYGADWYRRNEKLRQFILEYRSKHESLDFMSFDLEEDPGAWIRTVDFLSQPSLFVGSKLAVVKESGSVFQLEDFSKDDFKKWKKALTDCLDSVNIFLVISDRNKASKECGFLLKDPVKAQEFEALASQKLEAFLHLEARRRKVVFDARAWDFFFGYVSGSGDPSSRGVEELEKISLAGFPQPISLANLQKIITWVSFGDSYRLAFEFMKASSWERRLVCLEYMFSRGDAPRYILNFLSSLARSKKDVFALARLDEFVKSGAFDDEVALAAFALEAGLA